jgi:hypothetical protein
MMPKQKKLSKKVDDEDFDEVLTEFRAGDLATVDNAASTTPATSRSSAASTLLVTSSSSQPMKFPPSPVTANVAGRNVSVEAIVNACKRGDVAQLRRWIRQGVRVRTHELLRQAVYNGASFDVLSCLVKELSADVNGRDKDGWTALTLAVYLDHHDTVHYLVEVLGADVNIRNKLGQTPLYLAAARGQLALCEFSSSSELTSTNVATFV